ncbi:hypothetical protein EV122DRAFT_294013 [Schizophyllum commune]
MTSAPRSALLALPTELLVPVLSYLNVQDVWAVRKTCRALYAVSKLKCIWIARVRHMCATNHVFIPTFDLPSMSVAALERAATAPQRFFRLIKASGGGSKLYPVRRGTLSLAQDGNAVPGFDSFRQIRLVPGGRFMLARTRTEFQIWDLEMPAGHSGVLYSASLKDLLDVPEAALTHINMEDCYRGSEETSLRIIFTQCCDRDSSRYWRFLLIQADFVRQEATTDNSERPSLEVDAKTVAQLSPLVPLDSRPYVGSAANALITIRTDVDIMIWNPAEDTVAYWRIDPLLERTLRAVHFTREHAFCIFRDIVTVSSIPPFLDAHSKESWIPTSTHPYETALNLRSENCAWLTPRPWHTTNKDSSTAREELPMTHAFDRFAGSSGLSRYAVGPSATVETSHTDRSAPTVRDRWQDSNICFDYTCAWMPVRGFSVVRYNPVVESEGAVCPCVRAPWGFNVGLLAYGGSPAGSVEVKLNGVESFDGWDVCPASARVVCIDRREPHCVVVYDFLA